MKPYLTTMKLPVLLKKRLSFLSALVALAFSTAAQAESAAGTVLYFKTKGEVFLLLAEYTYEDAQKRGWSAFSGGPEKGESPAETAARQTEEETRGYFSREQILKKIGRKKPIYDGSFAFFFIAVDFVPAPRVTHNEVPPGDEDYSERGPYAWVPYSEVAKHIAKEIDRKHAHSIDSRYLPKERSSDWFWPVWLGNIRRAIEAGALPW